MIPKSIHFCWFGGKPKSELSKSCIRSWHEILSDYEFHEHNENTFDVNSSAFTKFHYERSNFAFVSDYVRAWALYEFGGIYLDTDVQVKHTLNAFLSHGAFSGFERTGYPFTAVWGSTKGHEWPKKVLDYYEATRTEKVTSTFSMYATNTSIVSKLLIDEYGIQPNRDEYQEANPAIAIYPSTTFCLDLPMNFTSHHFEGSWLASGTTPYKKVVHRKWQLSQALFNSEDDVDFFRSVVKLLGTVRVIRLVFNAAFRKVKREFRVLLRR